MVFHKLKTALDILATYPLFIVSHLMPRNKYIWVCSGWHRGADMEIFADNTKYFFLYTSHHCPHVHIVWLAKDRAFATLLTQHGYRAYYEKSIQGIWYALRAKITLVDANLLRENARWSGGSILIQLLHGKGYKKAGYTTKPIKKFDYIFVPSLFVADLLPDTVKHDAQIRITGYPRNDIFFRNITDARIGISSELDKKITAHNQGKIIWYAPTFRRGQQIFDIKKILNPQLLNPWLEKNNFFLYISLHPKYRAQMRERLGERIYVVPDSDIYPILPHVDVLVNDYSSLFADFLLLDKPIVFYPYDLDTYTKEEGFNIDYLSYSPGPKVYHTEALLDAIDSILSQDTYQSERRRVRNTYHTYPDELSSKRAVEAVLKIVTS